MGRQEIPENWTKAVIIPIHKAGDLKNPDNYRGISLLNSEYSNILKTNCMHIMKIF